MTITKRIQNIKLCAGVADQYAYDVEVKYFDDHGNGTETDVVTFTGSKHGAPVAVTVHGIQTFVENWRQYGDKLNIRWIRRFYGVRGA